MGGLCWIVPCCKVRERFGQRFLIGGGDFMLAHGLGRCLRSEVTTVLIVAVLENVTMWLADPGLGSVPTNWNMWTHLRRN
jgi:hypothetical protein